MCYSDTMKRFLSAIIVLNLLLCSHIGYAQDEPKPTTEASQPTSASQSHEGEQKAEKQQNRKATRENSDADICAKELTVDDCVTHLAEETFKLTKTQTCIGILGLIGLAFTVGFAGLAWRSSRESTIIAQEVAIAEYRPHIKVSDIFLTESFETIEFHQRKHATINGKVNIRNIGKTSMFLRSVSVFGTVHILHDEINIGAIKIKNGPSMQGREITPNGDELISVRFKGMDNFVDYKKIHKSKRPNKKTISEQFKKFFSFP